MDAVKFLLVDDVGDNLLALNALLTRDGLELLQARSGREALELLLIHDVALAVLDVQMPEMDGFELATLMRGAERTRRIPIIFVTAGASDLQRRFRGYEAGAVDFLFKPIDPDMLRSKADVFFELYRQRQEVVRQRDLLDAANAQLRKEIAERRMIEKTLRESEQRFRIALQKSPVVVFSQDRELRYSWVYNPQAGLAVDEVLGKRDDEIYSAEDAALFMSIKREVMTSGRRRRDEVVTHRPASAGGDLVHDMITEPLHDEAGGVIGVICAASNITERKRAEELLRRSNVELERRVEERTAELARRAVQLRALAGELALTEQRERRRLAKVLHDHLQQLLVAAKFRLITLGKGGSDGTRQAAKEIEDLVDDSIKASRSLTAELSPPILQEAGLKAGLEWLARRMAETQGLTVAIRAEQVPDLADDVSVLVFESVRELLFNVVKHSGIRTASIEVDATEESIQVTVSDEGLGFDPGMVKGAGEAGGGFGLFGIRERLGLYGGRLEIQSAPERGSRVTIWAPKTRAAKSQPAAESSLGRVRGARPTSLPSSQETIRVLVVDDHAVVREGMANLLSNEPDIEVVGMASDGRTAIELVDALLPDAILMDISMPGLNGVEATRIIHQEHPEICIMGLSMYEESERAQAMCAAGAAGYFAKSGPTDGLIGAIRKRVGQRERTACEPGM